MRRTWPCMATHEAARYRAWELWALLNTPNEVKRRRLHVEVHQGKPPTVIQGESIERALVELPGGSQDYHVALHVGQYATPDHYSIYPKTIF